MQTLRSWLTATALPFWHDAGFASGHGRFHERLDAKGQPLAVPHRSMVQARQIFVFAHAAHVGWFVGGERAEVAMAALRRDFMAMSDGEASFAFSIDPAGRVVSPVRDAYGHAFVLFALAWLYRLNGDRRLLDLADAVIRFIDRHLADAGDGGLLDQHPAPHRAKRQNPVMHLLEAYLALDAAAPQRGYIERAGALVALFQQRLFDDRRGVLLEHFGADWCAHPDADKRDVVEPGHHFEWVWLLDAYQTRTGVHMRPWSDRLYDHAMRHGTAGGLIVDEVSPDGHLRKGAHRTWPHTEAIKAAAVRHAAGDAAAAPFAWAMAQALLHHFLDRPFPGGWMDHIAADHRPLLTEVPASSLYHLCLAATEMDRLLPAPADG